MRVAIPSDNEQTIAAHTGRCKGFVIFDVDNAEAKKVEYRANNMTHHMQGHGHLHEHGHEHGHGHGDGHHAHSHRGLLDGLHDCQMLVARGMGPRLIQDLEQNGIEVFFSMEREVEKAADALAKGELQANPRGSSCHHGH